MMFVLTSCDGYNRVLRRLELLKRFEDPLVKYSGLAVSRRGSSYMFGTQGWPGARFFHYKSKNLICTNYDAFLKHNNEKPLFDFESEEDFLQYFNDLIVVFNETEAIGIGGYTSGFIQVRYPKEKFIFVYDQEIDYKRLYELFNNDGELKSLEKNWFHVQFYD